MVIARWIDHSIHIGRFLSGFLSDLKPDRYRDKQFSFFKIHLPGGHFSSQSMKIRTFTLVFIVICN